MALGKMIVFSGPSGSGKSTLARFVLSKLKSLLFRYQLVLVQNEEEK